MDPRRLPSSVVIASNAALLFVIQPMIAKTLLPRFGGSAGVWVTSMMFFQVVLLLGYLYAFWITRYLRPAVRTAIHLAALALSLAVLPVGPPLEWASANATLSVLYILARSIGLPFLVLSATGPLVQSWYASSATTRLPYWLFAVSNAASLAALLSYPVAIEPALATTVQLRWWSLGYAATALLLAVVTLQNRAWTFHDESGRRAEVETPEDPSVSRPVLWIALAACASALWLAVANYISQEVAPIPFLWVLPLALYLLTFILCFGWEGWYRQRVFRWLLPCAWIAVVARIGVTGASGDARLDIPILLAGLLVLCLFCHGELARTKPARRQDLAFFYLMVALGGAAGGVFVGLVAPAVFSSYLELPIAIVGTVFLSLILVFGVTAKARLVRLAVLAAAAFLVATRFQGGPATVSSGRNFYGGMQILDSDISGDMVRMLYNGRTMHGAQFLSPVRRQVPTAYYGRKSGAGLLLAACEIPNRRVAIIGLGAGTLATYGRKGDLFRFYEINPAVIQAAATDFHFLSDSAATVNVVQGDGRLGLEEEMPRSFDLMVLDAFSDDAIPVHLLTRQAFLSYFERLTPGGVLAIHVTNRYLDLNPVIESLAADLQLDALRIHSAGDLREQTKSADWVIVGAPGALLERLRPYSQPASGKRARLWTDDYSNLFQVWR